MRLFARPIFWFDWTQKNRTEKRYKQQEDKRKKKKTTNKRRKSKENKQTMSMHCRPNRKSKQIDFLRDSVNTERGITNPINTLSKYQVSGKSSN